MSFLFLILSFSLLVFSRQILINLLTKIVGPNLVKKLYFLLFFPGVLIHEVSHLFMAGILFVPTGEISVFPEDEKMGSVQVAKTDPIRQALIGVAPTIIGTAIILAIFQIVLGLPSKILNLNDLFYLINNGKNLLFIYFIFAINNTMFTSESDRRSWLGLFVLLILILSFLYLFDLFPVVTGPFLNYAALGANLITRAYLSTFLINLIFIIPLFISQKIIKKIRQ